jgi:hypothetical protein
LKFRRQHPIGAFIVDFACQSHHLVVELDGDYHDHIQEKDLQRERILESQGWKVIRFENDDVLKDAEAVARSIAKELGLPYTFRKRSSKRSGIMSENAPNRRPREKNNTAASSPHPDAYASDLP